jgi:hypothetical protein
MATLLLDKDSQQAILRLARPLPVRIRDAFYQRLSVELQALPELGTGAVYRTAARVQREFFDAPVLDGVEETPSWR